MSKKKTENSISSYDKQEILRQMKDYMLLDRFHIKGDPLKISEKGELRECTFIPKNEEEISQDAFYIVRLGTHPIVVYGINGADETLKCYAPLEEGCEKKEKQVYEREKKDLLKKVSSVNAELQVKSAEAAQTFLKQCAPATNANSYLFKKGIQAVTGLLQDDGGDLVVPREDIDGSVWGYQRIREDGSKKYNKHSRVAGTFFRIAPNDESLENGGFVMIGEGLATMVSVYECSGHQAFVAFSANNLLPVAQAVRTKFPTAKIIICADNDWQDKKTKKTRADNPGKRFAEIAASQVRALVALCPEMKEGSDFNDFHQEYGEGAVKREIDLATSGCPIPSGFAVKDLGDGEGEGLYFLTAEGESRIGDPIRVECAARIDEEEAMYLSLSFTDIQCVKKTRYLLAREDIANSKKTSPFNVLQKEGWSGNPKYKGKLDEFLSLAKPFSYRVIAKGGWTSDRSCFAIGEDLFTIHAESPTIHPVYTTCISQRDDAFDKGGTLEKSLELLKLCRGNPFLILAVTISLAAPLLPMLEIPTFGMHIYCISSRGKTTALQLAQSIFGPCDLQHIQNWRSTDNALENTLAARNHIPVMLDEIGQAKESLLGDVVYMIANGSGKARMSSNTEARKTKTWQTTVLSTGEKSIADSMTHAGIRVRAGQEVRMVDLPIEDIKCGVFKQLHHFSTYAEIGDHIKDVATHNYGHISRLFIKNLMENFNDIDEGICSLHKDITEQILGDINEGQIGRVAKYFALLVLVGNLMRQFGIWDLNAEEIFEAMHELFLLWATERSERPTEEKQIIDVFQALIERDGSTRFQKRDSSEPVPNCLGYYDQKKREYYIFPGTFDDLCKKNQFNKKRVIQVLLKAGCLKKSTEQDRNTVKVGVVATGGKQKTYYALIADAFPLTEHFLSREI